MFRSKKRRAVTPIKNQDPSTLLREHVAKKLDAKNVLVSEYDVIEKQKPIPFWKRDVKLPGWLLMLLVSLAVVLFTAFIVFTSIVTLKKEGNGGPCKSNDDCRQDIGLLCNNYRCGCAYSHFWSDTYETCERRRMINRTCVNDSMCDNLADLLCLNITSSTGETVSQCQCKASMTWNTLSLTCGDQGLFNESCHFDSECDDSRYLYCNTIVNKCQCNSSMFWNGNTDSTGTCEYRRTVDQFCYPYKNEWCDNTAPFGQGLICAQYTNPYGSEYGICQCPDKQFYNGSALLANGFCEPLRLLNGLCASTSQCEYRIGLVCLSSLCTCPAGYNYDASVNIGGVIGLCKPSAGYLENCSISINCSSSQNLFCDLSYYGSANLTGICLCNDSWSYWDGIICAKKLSLGGQCTNNTQCISSQGLFCSNYSQSIGQCDCDKNHFWNETCLIKQEYNTTCDSTYQCDDNRGLQCQGLGGAMFQKCDCYNTSYIWDSLYVTNRSRTCIPKLTINQTSCFGDLECEDFNYLVCNNGTCGCHYTDYWDGNRCQPKRNYTDPCSTTNQCRDFPDVYLICRLGDTVPAAYQCLCNVTSYWEECLQKCIVSKHRHQQCTLTGNCTSNECDKTQNLQCINDTNTNVTAGYGWCNCTSLQWWNGTYCRNKGTPAWGANSSSICNDTYQCADYNLVSCPLGGNYPTINSTCECATTKYWDGYGCLDRGILNDPCILWPHDPVKTSTCLSAAGAGLNCSSSSCTSGTNCTGGTCQCPGSTIWNSTFLICAATGTG